MLTITLPELARQIHLARRQAITQHCQACGERAGLLRKWGRWLVCEVCWSER